MSKLAQALLGFQKDSPQLHRDSTNPHFRNKYLSLEGLMSQVLPALNAQGLVLMQFPAAIDGQPALRTKLLHAESGEFEEDTMPLMLAKNDPQAQGSGLTYARRYAAMSVLGLVADEDDDGNLASRPQRNGATGDGKVDPPSSPAGAATRPPAPSAQFTPPAQVQEQLAAKAASSVPNQAGGSAEMVVKSFGKKHNGLTMGEILEKDPAHVRWLAGDEFEAKSAAQAQAKQAAQVLLGLSVEPYAGAVGGAPVDDSIPFERTI